MGIRITEYRRSRVLKYVLSGRFFKLLASIALISAAIWWPARSPMAADVTRILALGDSLTAGYGLAADAAFPARLEARLRREGHNVKVLNGGVSGDTSAGGLARLGWALADRPDLAIVELGANDGLRGLSPEAMKENLDAILRHLKAGGVRVLLAGMRAPPNMGPDYEAAFNAVYPALAREHGVVLYPFFLAGVASRPALNQRDGIHPNERGVEVIVDRIAPFVVRLLDNR